ncbi:ABC-type transport auxiliary lipoprotein family protein [Pseudomonas oryzihabitans]|uniref:ABC-type transport auxiliary lipoprotein family protein n=1 Tax=Pseudomonas oryzihabitans TaxID=47885 RepID=UPI0020963BEB|nr:ABC-type transport auxiliary lipoprotein family protein [Pseudomonas psychrotolerans]
MLRIKVDLQRFDSQPGRGVQQDALWTLRLAEPGGERVLTCGSRISQPAGGSYAEVVAAHRQALATLARRIEPVARAFVVDGATVCPAG